ncbi:MAG: PhoH family protein [Saprospiraceae bacterium]|uniref:PhoH-like protein n=1 Tax=Candidatus Defluviibacterium haderslevense TaxID=2981993 RepID=A0A9D7S7M2_9BACT|nr:PhoH family protein [Candidatus Defluviibacterium haderslevense]MBK9716864.1 PhoH family protein [Candidatus Defluviibacterium haderslevense]MBL0236093.1 PhoH family protein [Candidatus Defluviibacterium haderslevense]HRI33235.1 PhoH family protein [Saprospiraceae bacterium]
MSQSEIILTIENIDPISLYGERNSKLNLIRKAFPDITITSRGSQLKIVGKKSDAQEVKHKIELMVKILREHHELSVHNVEDLLQGDNPLQIQISQHENKHVLLHGREGKAIYAKTKNQLLLVKAVEENDIVFAIGPAGTGKTYTAVALAVRALKNKQVKKIILTRPAVEAGESLGFLPGDLKEKIDPYLRPLYDALDDMIPAERLNQFIENRVIEIAPLAFMRGRTLDNAFIILDEAQNSTTLQMKMFLTRLGPSAKCIITGDLTQIDLPYRQTSGLKQAIKILGRVTGITSVFLTIDDVVRHRLVKDILKAYEKEDNRNRSNVEEE